MTEALRPVTDWELEQLARGELTPAEARSVEARLRAHGEEDRLHRLRASDEEILRAYPPRQVAAEVRRRFGERRRPRALAFVPLAAVAAAAVLLVSLRPGPRPDAGAPSAEEITLRGLSPQLRIYRKGAAGAAPLAAGARVSPGDTLQVAYVAGERRYGVIASMDSAGTVTLHLPEAPGGAARLAAGGERATPHAFRLDATPGFERFVFIAADEPFSTELAARALRAGAHALPSSYFRSFATVHKETP